MYIRNHVIVFNVQKLERVLNSYFYSPHPLNSWHSLHKLLQSSGLKVCEQK